MANLFESLSAGRPQHAKEVAKRQLKNTGLITQWAKDEKIKAFLMEAFTPAREETHRDYFFQERIWI